IFTSRLDQMRDVLLDLSLYATPCRYRLLDCEALAQNREVRLYEFSSFFDVPYTTVSYTWRGNETTHWHDDPSDPTYWKDVYGTFQVKGAEGGDPISLDVLDHVCILQTSKPDKLWQISRMYSIYKSCNTCCVLPGGIRRLVAL
ncbi:hypothetical protein K435DRAFT_702215, partial [Dendrothele bispora CBS 962.96]